MDDGELKSEGWGESIRRTGDSILGLLQNRLELAGVELQEEKLRAIRLLVWLAVAIALGTAGLLVAMGALALFLWVQAGYLGLIGLAVLALGGSAALLHTLHRRIHTAKHPFADTAAEFRKDRECLRPEK